MKDHAAKPSAFGTFARIFTRNWGLKLLSLALAILIYYTLKPGGPDRKPGSRMASVIEQVANSAPGTADTSARK